MKKQMERMRVRIEQNLNRTEKSVVLTQDLLKIEEIISSYKHVCQTVHKKFSEGIQGYGKGTDGQSIERRLKKSTDFSLGQTLTEQGRLLTKGHSSSCLGQVLVETGQLCTSTGMNLVQYEISVEQLVLSELDQVIKTDLPNILQERKQLDRLILELDTSKARLKDAKEETEKQGATVNRVEKMSEELDDMARKVEQARDLLATDMMSFMAKDAELANLIAKYLDFKREYHTSIAEQVMLAQPKVDSVLLTKRGFPIFGTSIADHLEGFSLTSGIAFPLQLCATRLVELGLEEEGLFRLAAGASKVKRFRAEIEAGYASLAGLDLADHHILTTIIKSYLRELPEPLMGADLYHDWLEAGKLDGEDRFDVIWNLLQHESLPRENYRNIQYLFKFLHEVTKLSELNKMTASNLAIVITPNVIWDCEGVHDTMDVSVGNSLAQVVELIIDQYDWFFQNDDQSLDWGADLPTTSLGPCPPPPPGPEAETLGFALASVGQTSLPSTSSPVPTTRERKSKGKKAPAPPGESPGPSPQHHNQSGEIGWATQPAPLSPVLLRRDSPASSPRATKSHESSPAYQRSKSSESRVISQPPSHPPPNPKSYEPRVISHPPSHPPPNPPTQSNLSTTMPDLTNMSTSLYPTLSQDEDIDTPTENEKSTAQFPVPAPRFSKPALPNKPEGLSRSGPGFTQCLS